MTKKIKKLVIVGAGEFGEIAYEYFTSDSEYEVMAFSVEKAYRKEDTLLGKPVVDFETVEDVYPPEEYEVFVAVTFPKLNRARTQLYQRCKKKGYRCASYISSQSFVWHNAKVGENTFIFESSTIQHYAEIGNNVIIWCGSSICHRAVVEDNCWLAPHSVICGFSRIGKYSFIGSNATIVDEITIAEDTLLGAGSVAVKSIEEPGKIFVGNPARKLEKTSYEKFGVE